MLWLEQLFYGLASGLAACFPISLEAHQDILGTILGFEHPQPLLHLMIDLGCLLALVVACSREWSLLHRSGGGDRAVQAAKNRMTLTMLKTALPPMLVMLVLTRWFGRQLSGLLVMSAFLIANGMLLFIPQQLPVGNRDARTLSPLASVLMGLAGGLAGFSGISCLAAMLCAALALGVSRSNALNYTYLLYIPGMLMCALFDGAALAAGMEAVSAIVILRYLLAALGAYAGSSMAIMAMRSLAVKAGFTGFAFYSWGAAMLALILYLMT